MLYLHKPMYSKKMGYVTKTKPTIQPYGNDQRI
jgi:hypothetical protein